MKRREFIAKSGAITATSLLYAPNVIASKTLHWKMVTTWPKNFPGLGTGANNLAKTIEKLSGGKIKIKVYGAGELVPALGIFDAVKRGTAQIGHGASYYWKGKHEATQFFGAVPFGLNAQEMNAWLYYGGGQKLWDDLYADFGLKPFSAGNSGVQMGGWYNKKIINIKSFKGLKIRMPGLGGEVLRRLGATVVNIPGGELYQSLKSGAIDALEWVGPMNDEAFGFFKAANFYYWPGWHEPGTTIEAMFNKKAFDALPGDLKDVVRFSCQAATVDMLSEFTFRNSVALKNLKIKHKVKVLGFPDSVLKHIAKTSKEVLNEAAKRNATTKKVYNSYNSFMKDAIEWQKVSEEGYSVARTNAYN